VGLVHRPIPVRVGVTCSMRMPRSVRRATRATRTDWSAAGVRQDRARRAVERRLADADGVGLRPPSPSAGPGGCREPGGAFTSEAV